MPKAKQWLLIGAGVAVLAVGAVSQEVSANVQESAKPKNETVLVHFYATGDAVRAKVNWTTPEGSQSWRGELPLKNTTGTEGVSYRLPAGAAVSITVTNERSTAGSALGFAGRVGCRIDVDGFPVASEFKTGFDASTTCSALASPPLG